MQSRKSGQAIMCLQVSSLMDECCPSISLEEFQVNLLNCFIVLFDRMLNSRLMQNLANHNQKIMWTQIV